ncbi:MAG: hypothetical protein KC592_09195, partial [Nitrospira sp.]|nr:hypothetical protein [Nitrospira sp.]
MDEVHRQLIQMIRDLPSCWDERDTIERMMEMAGNVKIHTTSANAYMKLNRIGRLRKDYGLTKEEETGIPGIHQHLTEIGQEIGAEFNAEMALKRINQLSDEIAFFFRATGKDETPKVEQARSRFHQEKEKFSAKIREAQKLA